MIVVTGAAGFIGSNIVKGLKQAGYQDILAVDDLKDGFKYQNLAAADCDDYMDYRDFLSELQMGSFPENGIEAIFHQGACSNTMEWDGQYMMEINYDYSKQLFNYCVGEKIPFIYASSAAVYGASEVFDDRATKQMPLNVYGYSKWLFDRYFLNHLSSVHSKVVGFRYFNVYGPHEQHKGSMASVAWHFMNQLKETGKVKLFEGCGQYGNGEQLRDFIFVDDVVKANIWFFENQGKNGVYNLGTEKARSFNDVAKTLIKLYGKGEIEYVPFPERLKGAYQSYTQADLTALREAGYSGDFHSLEDGLKKYYEYWSQNKVGEI